MQHVTLPQMEEKIARCRVVFSGLVTAAVLLDPFQPLLNPWRTLMGSSYVLERDFLGTILLHLLYSTVVYAAFRNRPIAATRFTWLTTSTDVLFAVAIAFVTEGRNSLFYPFISFAIVESALRWGLRRTLMVTAAGAGLWIAMIVMWAPDDVIFYLMRPLYLMFVGYLIGYLGEQRLAFESEVRTLEANEERLRIARDLHDGCMQLLAALNLQLEHCQRLVRSGQTAELLADLRELQESVNSEHDELRVYLRALAGVGATGASTSTSDPRVRLRLEVDTSAALVDHVLRIVREGVTNIRRHADARQAQISATMHDTGIRISIDDDGRGFARDGDLPWSILSRVTELGGSLEMRTRDIPGAHLMISLPVA